MTGRDVLKQIRIERKPEQCFIKWWRIENDFVDFELVDAFIESARNDEEFAGYELLNMEQMWETLSNLKPESLTRGKKDGQDVIFWEQEAENGSTRSRVCPYSPDSLISVFDAVTKGNYID